MGSVHWATDSILFLSISRHNRRPFCKNCRDHDRLYDAYFIYFWHDANVYRHVLRPKWIAHENHSKIPYSSINQNGGNGYMATTGNCTYLDRGSWYSHVYHFPKSANR